MPREPKPMGDGFGYRVILTTMRNRSGRGYFERGGLLLCTRSRAAM